MPSRGTRTPSIHTSLAVTSQSHTVGTAYSTVLSSTATDAVPALSRGTSRTTSSSSVRTGLASFIGTRHLLEEEEGALVVPNMQRPVCIHRCLFHFLDCLESFDVYEEWRVHVLSHFRGHAPPTEAQCPLCSQKMADPGRDRAWNFMLRHIATEHFQIGQDLARCRPDFSLFKFLFNRKIINGAQYKALFMTKTPGPYQQHAQPNAIGHGPSNAPFVSTANPRRQQRAMGQERRAQGSRPPG